MLRDKMDRLIDLLLEKTRSGSIVWIKEDGGFEAKFQDGWVRVEKRRKSYRVMVMRDENDRNGLLRAGNPDKDARLESLYQCIKGSYGGRVQILNSILDELDSPSKVKQ